VANANAALVKERGERIAPLERELNAALESLERERRSNEALERERQMYLKRDGQRDEFDKAAREAFMADLKTDREAFMADLKTDRETFMADLKVVMERLGQMDIEGKGQ
jgi:hypothetical protein